MKGKMCVISTPTRGKSWIEDVFSEIDRVNEYKDINFAIEPTLSASLMTQRFGRYDRQRMAIREWFKPAIYKIYNDWLMSYLCLEINKNLESAINFTLPRFTFRDHLRDCFGWVV
jgi:hypothetical protein